MDFPVAKKVTAVTEEEVGSVVLDIPGTDKPTEISAKEVKVTSYTIESSES